MNVPTMAEMMAAGKQPKVLFWVGSAGSYDDRAKKISRAFVKILHQANVDFAVLGTEESSTGCDPHSFNTLKNEYPSLGGNYQVYHHTQFIKKLIDDGKLSIDNRKLKGKRVTFHDPCYLGRANDVYESPRDLIRRLGVNLTEMKRHKSTALCCGAGGAQMFKEPEKGDKDINVLRTEDALETKPQIIATGCPYCNTMMTDGIKFKEKENQIQVKDIAELIMEANNL